MRRQWGRVRYRFGARLGPRRSAAGLPPATVILMSYRRPGNMRAIVGEVLRLGFVERVVVSNNNPDVALRISIRDRRLAILQQDRHRRASIRMALARDTAGERFLTCDDDLFLRAEQMEELYRRFLAQPEIVHGLVGSMRLPPGTDKSARSDLRGDRELDVVSRVAAFSRAHVDGWFRNLATLGLDSPDELQNGEDILLSLAGSGRPRCHDLGPLLECETTYRRGIALSREEGFHDRRRRIYDRLVRDHRARGQTCWEI
ncbi:MAG: hypothetical protein AAGD14_11705 [Planctomycetota bacterium]